MRLFIAAHSKEGTTLPPPLRIPRPSGLELDEAPKTSTKDEVRAFFRGAGGKVIVTPKSSSGPDGGT
jgi:hypothetical protein